jgi:hypothetical protein
LGTKCEVITENVPTESQGMLKRLFLSQRIYRIDNIVLIITKRHNTIVPSGTQNCIVSKCFSIQLRICSNKSEIRTQDALPLEAIVTNKTDQVLCFIGGRSDIGKPNNHLHHVNIIKGVTSNLDGVFVMHLLRSLQQRNPILLARL